MDGRQWAEEIDEWLDEVIVAAPPAGNVWWAVEEPTLEGVDGRRYAVAECVEDVFTLSVGFAAVVCEVEVPIPGGIDDGFALLLTDAGVTRANTSVAQRLVWLGPAHDTCWRDHVDDAVGLELVGAVSEERLGAVVAAGVATTRPDLTVLHDPGWRSHRHPLRGLLDRLDPTEHRFGTDLPPSWTDGTFHADPLD